MAFNLANNQKAERKLLVTAVNVGTTSSPQWDIVGRGVEDSSIDFNADIESTTDILGITETDVNSMAPQQNLEPMTIRGGSKLAEKLYDIWRRNANTEYTAFEVMIIHGYAGTAGKYEAEVHKGCTIVPTSLGGSSHVDMPVEIHFSNDKDLGTVNALSGAITFTKTSTASLKPGEVLVGTVSETDTSGKPFDEENTVKA